MTIIKVQVKLQDCLRPKYEPLLRCVIIYTYITGEKENWRVRRGKRWEGERDMGGGRRQPTMTLHRKVTAGCCP